MKTPLDIEIRSRIAAVLAGNVQPRDFYHWLGPSTWGIKAREHPEAARLTYAIEHLVAELSNGDITPREFKRDLQLTASTYLTVQTPWNRAAGIPVTTTSANAILEAEPTALDLRQRAAAIA